MNKLILLAVSLFLTELIAAAPTADQLLARQTQQWLESAKISNETPFAKALLSSTDWQHELQDSGPVHQPATVLTVLHGIWKKDPNLVSNPINRAMATACALEAPARKWTTKQVLPRYDYFKEKWQYGLLNTMYAKLTVFERRYLARGVQHTGFNTLDSMNYQNQEVCLPAEKYTGACWYARWILHNHFGDSIHGRYYYEPYAESWGSYAEMVRNVGGVCGSLSNFGASAAIANGIPAVTMGEPGHCAYAVLTKPNRWQPAYSLSWKRGTHTSFHGGSWGWHIYNNRFHQNHSDAKKSGNLRRLANYQLSQKQIGNALKTISQARCQYPLDWQNWLTSVKTLNSIKASQSQWRTLHNDTIKYLAPNCGEIAWQLLEKHIYPHVLPKGKDDSKDRGRILLSFQKALADWGVGRWDYARSLNAQLKLLGGTPEMGDQFLASAFATHAEANLFTGDIISTQLKRVGDDQKRLQAFLASISKTLAKGKDGSYSKVIESLAARILPSAAKRGDKATFQAIGKLTAKIFPANPVKPDKFPGILLSSGGTFSITKPGNRWDAPSRHWGVIEEHGGDFHTSNKPAVATVQLGNYGRISGVVIVTRAGNYHRLVGAQLQTSIDGKDWVTAHTFTKHQRIHRIDLTAKKITAGYVRVIHPNQPSLHFNKFHIYGKKQN